MDQRAKFFFLLNLGIISRKGKELELISPLTCINAFDIDIELYRQ